MHAHVQCHQKLGLLGSQVRWLILVKLFLRHLKEHSGKPDVKVTLTEEKINLSNSYQDIKQDVAEKCIGQSPENSVIYVCTSSFHCRRPHLIPQTGRIFAFSKS